MTNAKGNGRTLSAEDISLRRRKFGTILFSDPNGYVVHEDKDSSRRRSSSPSVPSPRFYTTMSATSSPNGSDDVSSPYGFVSPFSQPSPFTKSPWTTQREPFQNERILRNFGLIGSLVREEGHVYSLAASGDLLYTGSESKNIRVWKNSQEFSGFKSGSGLVKAIVLLGDKIFTGHQDGKIRVWRFSEKEKKAYKRIGSLPTTKAYLKTSINPKNYVEVRRNRVRPWIKHFDAISCMNVDVEHGLLYSVSWDQTLKVWRVSDSKCMDSIIAHDDAVNAVVVGFDGLIFTGSADGTVKVWRREVVGKYSKHVLVVTLLKQENAVTSLAANEGAGVIYAGSSDGLVNFWERRKHELLSHGGVLRGHKLAVLCLAAAGSLVMSGSADKSICVWRRGEGGSHTCVSVLTGHTGPVKCLAVEEDREEIETAAADKGGQRWIVYSGSLDKSVKVWRVPEHAPHLRTLSSVEQTRRHGGLVWDQYSTMGAQGHARSPNNSYCKEAFNS